MFWLARQEVGGVPKETVFQNSPLQGEPSAWRRTQRAAPGPPPSLPVHRTPSPAPP